MSDQKLSKFVSLHVHKCGGTTLGFILQDLYDDKFFWDKSEDSVPVHGKILNYNQAHIKKFDVVHGHIHAYKYSYLKRPYITWLRHPVTRLESEYSIIRQKKYMANISPLHKRVLRDKLSFIDYCKEVRNVYTNYLGDLKVNDLAFIGITEYYEESLFVLSQILGMKLPPYYRRNSRRIIKQHFKWGTPDEKKICASLNEKDIAYYMEARKRLINEFKGCMSKYEIGCCAPKIKGRK